MPYLLASHCDLPPKVLPTSSAAQCRNRSAGAAGPGRKNAGEEARVPPPPAVHGSDILRPRLPSPAHLPRLYRTLNGRPGRPNSHHDELHQFGVINTPISASISREVIDTRSISPVNSGRRTMMALGVYGSPSREVSGIRRPPQQTRVLIPLAYNPFKYIYLTP